MGGVLGAAALSLLVLIGLVASAVIPRTVGAPSAATDGWSVSETEADFDAGAEPFDVEASQQTDGVSVLQWPGATPRFGPIQTSLPLAPSLAGTLAAVEAATGPRAAESKPFSIGRASAPRFTVPRPDASLQAVAGLVKSGLPAPLAALLPTAASAPKAGPAARAFLRTNGPAAITTGEVLANAERLLGIPYLWGGNTTAGLDCSAYVSKVWGVARHTTDTLSAVSVQISKEELAPGDALNLPTWNDPHGYGHVRLFDRWMNADHTRILVYEETGSVGRSIHRAIAYDERYAPMRRVNYAPDAAPPPPVFDLTLEASTLAGRFLTIPPASLAANVPSRSARPTLAPSPWSDAWPANVDVEPTKLRPSGPGADAGPSALPAKSDRGGGEPDAAEPAHRTPADRPTRPSDPSGATKIADPRAGAKWWRDRRVTTEPRPDTGNPDRRSDGPLEAVDAAPTHFPPDRSPRWNDDETRRAGDRGGSTGSQRPDRPSAAATTVATPVSVVKPAARPSFDPSDSDWRESNGRTGADVRHRGPGDDDSTSRTDWTDRAAPTGRTDDGEPASVDRALSSRPSATPRAFVEVRAQHPASDRRDSGEGGEATPPGPVGVPPSTRHSPATAAGRPTEDASPVAGRTARAEPTVFIWRPTAAVERPVEPGASGQQSPATGRRPEPAVPPGRTEPAERRVPSNPPAPTPLRNSETPKVAREAPKPGREPVLAPAQSPARNQLAKPIGKDKRGR